MPGKAKVERNNFFYSEISSNQWNIARVIVWKQLFNLDPLVIIRERKLPAHSKCQVLYFQSSTKKWVTNNDHISLKNVTSKFQIYQETNQI